MYFGNILAIVGLAAIAQACDPSQFACGNQNGAPGPDGSIYVCNSSGGWTLSAQCGGPDCCIQDSLSAAHCKC